MIELKPIITGEYCLKCQGCCRYALKDTVWSPQLLEEEKTSISPYVPIKKIQLVLNKAQNNFICQFLNTKDNKCKIYSVRPFDCVLYPFLLNRRGNKVYLSVDLKCPYIKSNTKIDEYNKYVQYLTDVLNNPATSIILKKNPQLIQSYEEVLDIVELKL
jgi:Fe-S-cluster containining protein